MVLGVLPLDPHPAGARPVDGRQDPERAQGVLLGRAWGYALAARGESGVVDLLEVIQQEMANTMALMGVRNVSELEPGMVDTRGICT